MKALSDLCGLFGWDTKKLEPLMVDPGIAPIFTIENASAGSKVDTTGVFSTEVLALPTSMGVFPPLWCLYETAGLVQDA